MQYDETSSRGGRSRASHSGGGHPTKPRDANDILRQEGADGLRRALDSLEPIKLANPVLGTSQNPEEV